jgi:hypothetical protein
MDQARDDIGNFAKFVSPTVVNGKVYMATFSNTVNVYGAITSTGQPVPNGTYRLTNQASGKNLDNLGSTADGATVGQWTANSSNNQKWTLTFSGGFYKLACVTGSKCLDSLGHTADGSQVGQWTSGSSANQQWTIVAAGRFWKVVNRANGKCLDSGGGTANGAIMQFLPNGSSTTQQWAIGP